MLGYLALLAASHAWRSTHPPQAPAPRADELRLEIQALGVDGRPAGPYEVAGTFAGERHGDDRPLILLLHGSPGSRENFDRLVGPLSRRGFRVLAPDLVGFHAPVAPLPGVGITVQALHMLQLLDVLGAGRAHVVGFSLGGGVGLMMQELAPDRVASLTLLSSIGVQELELLGDHRLNRLLHRLQAAMIWSLFDLVPHFGLLDGHGGLLAHAETFLQSDQRPLRGVLRRYEGPMLIVHGERDFLVPPAAAREHHRLVPQSELVMADASHFMVWTRPDDLAAWIGDFVGRVESGEAAVRADADPARLAAAAAPFDPSTVPPATGPFLWLLMLLIALATLVSEDLTCIGAGLMVAAGRIEFPAATLACVAGLVIGDMGLFVAGRLVGRAALTRAPLRWFIRPEMVTRSQAWFRRRGLMLVFASRFMPGARLPTYFAAGMVGTSFVSFSLCFLLAALLWTPLLVGLAALTGEGAARFLAGLHAWGFWGVALFFVGVLLAVRLGVGLVTHRGRRMLLGRWRRLVRWEFWPPLAFYPPIVLYVLWLGLKHRSLTLVTAANPGIPTGGVVGESKGDILEALARTAPPGSIAATLRLPDAPPAERLARAEAFMGERGLALPVVLKPDIGQRGDGVQIVATREALVARLSDDRAHLLLQEYVPGVEFGAMYARHPDAEHGAVLSITEKLLPVVTGDGQRTLEELILDDGRAVCMARAHFARHAERLADVIPAGERVTLVEVGTHCRGAIFLDGERHLTPELRAAVDALTRGWDGFGFGRFDLRVPDAAALEQGRELKVIELNGVTGESTNIYDPRHSVWHAWAVLLGQWRLAHDIAAAQVARGHRPTPLPELLGVLGRFLLGRSPPGEARQPSSSSSSTASSPSTTRDRRS